MNLSNYIASLIAQGQCCFALAQAEKEMKKPRSAIISSIQHLAQKGQLASPVKGFYVIIPPEYKILGCIPAEQFVPYIMKYLQQQYYVGLLSAARYHGATHQAPQIFQIVTEKAHLPIQCGKIKIEFVGNKNLLKMPLQKLTTAKSILTIATAELTAFDLIRYPDRCGGLNHIFVILEELIEKIEAEKLKSFIEKIENNAVKQRLGFLFEKLGATQLSNVIKQNLLQQKRLDYVWLEPRLKEQKEMKHLSDWKLIKNIELEGNA